MKKFIKGFLFILFFSFALYGCDIGKASELHDYFSNLHETKGFNGSVLVAKDGKIIYTNGYGSRDVEGDKDNNSQTIFNIASLSKQFTSMSIMMLVEEGLISVDDTVDMYVPEIVNGNRITIKQCLNHTSGLTEYLGNEELWLHTSEFHNPDQLLQYYASADLDFTPGSKWAYSNTNYITLGIIIERVSGQNLSTFLNERIFNKLKMRRSFYDAEEDDFYYNRSKGYDAIDPVTPAMYFHFSIAYAAGAFHSTVLDLFKWSKALETESLVSKKSLNEIFTPGLGNYGYGWFIDKLNVNGQKFNQKWHWGAFFGYGSYLTKVLDEDITVIILQNISASSPDDFQPIVQNVVSIVLDLE